MNLRYKIALGATAFGLAISAIGFGGNLYANNRIASATEQIRRAEDYLQERQLRPEALALLDGKKTAIYNGDTNDPKVMGRILGEVLSDVAAVYTLAYAKEDLERFKALKDPLANAGKAGADLAAASALGAGAMAVVGRRKRK